MLQETITNSLAEQESLWKTHHGEVEREKRLHATEFEKDLRKIVKQHRERANAVEEKYKADIRNLESENLEALQQQRRQYEEKLANTKKELKAKYEVELRALNELESERRAQLLKAGEEKLQSAREELEGKYRGKLKQLDQNHTQNMEKLKEEGAILAKKLGDAAKESEGKLSALQQHLAQVIKNMEEENARKTALMKERREQLIEELTRKHQEEVERIKKAGEEDLQHSLEETKAQDSEERQRLLDDFERTHTEMKRHLIDELTRRHIEEVEGIKKAGEADLRQNLQEAKARDSRERQRLLLEFENTKKSLKQVSLKHLRRMQGRLTTEADQHQREKESLLSRMQTGREDLEITKAQLSEAQKALQQQKGEFEASKVKSTSLLLQFSRGSDAMQDRFSKLRKHMQALRDNQLGALRALVEALREDQMRGLQRFNLECEKHAKSVHGAFEMNASRQSRHEEQISKKAELYTAVMKYRLLGEAKQSNLLVRSLRAHKDAVGKFTPFISKLAKLKAIIDNKKKNKENIAIAAIQQKGPDCALGTTGASPSYHQPTTKTLEWSSSKTVTKTKTTVSVKPTRRGTLGNDDNNDNNHKSQIRLRQEDDDERQQGRDSGSIITSDRGVTGGKGMEEKMEEKTEAEREKGNSKAGTSTTKQQDRPKAASANSEEVSSPLEKKPSQKAASHHHVQRGAVDEREQSMCHEKAGALASRGLEDSGSAVLKDDSKHSGPRMPSQTGGREETITLEQQEMALENSEGGLAAAATTTTVDVKVEEKTDQEKLLEQQCLSDDRQEAGRGKLEVQVSPSDGERPPPEKPLSQKSDDSKERERTLHEGKAGRPSPNLASKTEGAAAPTTSGEIGTGGASSESHPIPRPESIPVAADAKPNNAIEGQTQVTKLPLDDTKSTERSRQRRRKPNLSGRISHLGESLNLATVLDAKSRVSNASPSVSSSRMRSVAAAEDVGHSLPEGQGKPGSEKEQVLEHNLRPRRTRSRSRSRSRTRFSMDK